MDRQQLKFISALLALLMFMSPIASLAMQPMMPENQSSHCQDLETDSHSHQYQVPDQASCAIP
jgi:hypothetical protein